MPLPQHTSPSKSPQNKGLLSSSSAAAPMSSLSLANHHHGGKIFNYLVVAMVTLSIFITMVECRSIPEEKHHTQSRLRHHHRNKTLTFHVRNKEDALIYLQKYGYLEHCTILTKQMKKERLAATKSTTTKIIVDKTRYCTAREEKEAMRSLQEIYHLPRTGKLDVKTKKLMEIRRCGNADVPELDHSAKRRRKRSIAEYNATTTDNNSTSEKDQAFESTTTSTPSLGRNVSIVLPYYHLPIGTIREAQVNRSKEDNARDRMYRVKIELLKLNETGDNSDEDVINGTLNMTRNRTRIRKKRSLSEPGQRIIPESNGTTVIRWRLLRGESETLTFLDQKAALVVAFRMWAECVPVKFLEMSYVDVKATDTFVRFAKKNHMNCEKPFDGFGGELAHSWALGDIHFDGDEHFKKLNQYSGGIDMLRVAIHEVGHVLGLYHTEDRNSIMFPLYIHMDYDYDYEIPEVDRRAVQSMFGVCKLTYDTVFDWVYMEGERVYSSYFMRGERYWKYSNRYRKTSSDEEVDIISKWPDLPSSGINSFLQINLTETAYIFAGENCYKMDSTSSYAMPGYPKKISEEFPSKLGIETVPDDLDASFFYGTTLVYLLKGEWVWICNAEKIGQPDCCSNKVKFKDIFATKSTFADDDVTGNVTSVFYSHAHGLYYLIKDGLYYEVRAANATTAPSESSPAKFNLIPMGNTWQKWLDICES